MSIAPATDSTTYNKRTVAPFLIARMGIPLPKRWACSFSLKTANADAQRTAIVVVFIPPAVEPGEPPINIRIIINSKPGSLMIVKSTVLKPAVLGVMD